MGAKGGRETASSKEAVFERLRGILAQHADRLSVAADTKDRYCLEGTVGPATLRSWGGKVKRPQIPVAWVEIGKTGVNFHLLAMDHPAVRGAMSSALAKRMQGKTCFKFTSIDDTLLRELECVTRVGLAAFESAGFITS